MTLSLRLLIENRHSLQWYGSLSAIPKLIVRLFWDQPLTIMD